MFFPCPLDSCLVFDPESRKERSFKMSVRASSPWDKELSAVLTDQRIVVLSYWWGNAVCMCVSRPTAGVVETCARSIISQGFEY